MRSHAKWELAESCHLRARPTDASSQLNLFETPNDANSGLQEVMNIMMAEKRLEQKEKIEHTRRQVQVIKQIMIGPQETQSFSVAGHRRVRPHERSLEPLIETYGDETMMDNFGDDDAGETGCSQIANPANEPIGLRDCSPACDHYPHRDWCRACGGGIWRSSMDDQTAIKETFESWKRLGYPELIVISDNESAMVAFRDGVIRGLKDRFECPSNRTCSTNHTILRQLAWWKNAIKQVKEKVRTLVIATRELHGVVMDLEHVALAWCVCVCVLLQIMSRAVKGADGLTAFQRAFQRASQPRAMPSTWGEKIFYLEASKKKIQITDMFLDGIFLGTKEGSEEFIVGTPAGCVVCRTVKRRPREDAAEPREQRTGSKKLKLSEPWQFAKWRTDECGCDPVE